MEVVLLIVIILSRDTFHLKVLAFFWLSHGIALSLRQLKRILARRELRRRSNTSNKDGVLAAISTCCAFLSLRSVTIKVAKSENEIVDLHGPYGARYDKDIFYPQIIPL